MVPEHTVQEVRTVEHMAFVVALIVVMLESAQVVQSAPLVVCGGGSLSYVGNGQGAYIQETTYKYVGCGGDFDVMRPRRDFTCIITTCSLLPLLLLLLWWLLSGLFTTSLPFDCSQGVANWKLLWSDE